ncbi:MAG: HAD family acid phosphatase [Arenimonas sp.]
MKTTRLLIASSLVLALSACEMVQTKPQAVAEAAAPVVVEDKVAGHDNLNAVLWMQTSVEYKLLAGQTWRSGLVQLDHAIKSPTWDALTPDEREKPTKGLPMAVIVDVDETVLDNSPYQARLIRDGLSYNDATWGEWVMEEKATPIPGALEFARAASARGVTIFYLTNRAVQLQAATLDNLRKLGFPIKDDKQFLGLGYFVDNCEQQGSEKNCRRISVGRDYRVLMQFGDQIGDMVTVLNNTPEGREQTIKPYLSWVGERWFVLPNPSYGSWEPALFNNDWSKSEEERRAIKREALKY